MERYDAVVLGAGPAGSLTAYHLATAGASVLLLDRARFPRDKPCGGGLTGRAIKQLPFSVWPVVEDVVDRFELRLGYGRGFERHCAEPTVLMTQRLRLDAFLAERAAEAGADFRDGCRATSVSLAPDEAVVTVDGHRHRASVVVGADGVNGVTSRLVSPEYRYGVALEGNVRYDAVDERRYRGRAILELGIVPGGYGWVFAKGDHVNVGVGGWEEEAPTLRGKLRRLCDEHAVSFDDVRGIRGYRLPLRRSQDELARGRLALVGDAAGLVDPLSGDGIYEAFLSARLAADAIGDVLAGRTSDLEPYAVAVSAALAPVSRASWGAKLALDRFPHLTFSLLGARPVWGFLEKLLRGEVRSPGEANGLARGPLRLVERLGSVGSGRRYTASRTAA